MTHGLISREKHPIVAYLAYLPCLGAHVGTMEAHPLIHPNPSRARDRRRRLDVGVRKHGYASSLKGLGRA